MIWQLDATFVSQMSVTLTATVTILLAEGGSGHELPIGGAAVTHGGFELEHYGPVNPHLEELAMAHNVGAHGRSGHHSGRGRHEHQHADLTKEVVGAQAASVGAPHEHVHLAVREQVEDRRPCATRRHAALNPETHELDWSQLPASYTAGTVTTTDTVHEHSFPTWAAGLGTSAGRRTPWIGQHVRPTAAVAPSLSPLSRDVTHVAGLWRVALSRAASAPVSATRAEGPRAGPASEHEAKPSPPDGADVAFAPRAEWSVILHAPRWLATHMSPAGHLGDTNFRHGPGCAA